MTERMARILRFAPGDVSYIDYLFFFSKLLYVLLCSHSCVSTSRFTAAASKLYCGNCVTRRRDSGCEISIIEEAVCARDSFCCETMWDMDCASLVEDDEGLNYQCSGAFNHCRLIGRWFAIDTNRYQKHVVHNF